MSDIRDHRGLEAWRVAMDAVMETYAVSSDFPKSETYGLAGQMRRAAVSVPSNVAEGYVRGGRAEINQLGIALGSIAELDTQLEIARRREYISSDGAEHLQELIVSSRRLVNGLRRARRLKLGASVAVPVGLLLLTFRLFA
jgi:four helix bundle protein